VDGRANCGGGISDQILTQDLFGVTAAEQRRESIGEGRILYGTDVAGESDAGMPGRQVS
jgi:hypothetical protein